MKTSQTRDVAPKELLICLQLLTNEKFKIPIWDKLQLSCYKRKDFSYRVASILKTYLLIFSNFENGQKLNSSSS